ncbi:MAG: hypothetical protein Q4D38_05575 [Planctomycetia bacterium]|nr:hypothetical protein [Planctomycetia bacterium]
MYFSRRYFLQSLALGAAISPSASRLLANTPAEKKFPPCQALTQGPLFHWGAYYDQLHFDPSDRFVTGNEVDFQGRSPKPDDVIRVGLIDTSDKNRWTEIGTSCAWNWQQGPMLQWIPGRETFEEAEVIWNDREGDRFFSHVYSPHTGKYRELPGPAYVISPDGKFALYPDFARLNDTRPGYGYCGVSDRNASLAAPDDAGIWRMDLETGESRLIITFAQVADMAPPEGYSKGAKHWFNHLLIAPDSKRFLFLHRWRGKDEKSYWKTRLMTADADGGNIYVLNPHNMTSHLVWRDPKHVIAFARRPSHGDRFYVLEDQTQNDGVVGHEIMKVDGHVSYLPHTQQKWLLNDTYPDRNRIQRPFLFHIDTEETIPLGEFYLPPEFRGEWRCDLHPRSNRSGTKILIDSAHTGGRQIYMIDIRDTEIHRR